MDLDPADSSTAFSTAACWGPTRKNRLLSWQGNIIRVLQAGRLRRRVYFGVSHSGWPGSLWRTWKFNVSQSPDPVLPLPVLLSSWAGTKGRPGMRCWQECRAVCEVQLRGRGVVGAAGSGEQPSTAKKRGGQRNKPPFWGHEPGQTWHVGFAAPLPRVTALPERFLRLLFLSFSLRSLFWPGF